MLRFSRSLAAFFLIAGLIPLARAVAPRGERAVASRARHEKPEQPQETGFLNRKIEFHGVTYRFVVYLPEEWRRDDRRQWPILLALHGRGERGSEGMWQTQIGLPQAVRDHPERWPFIVVLPQCPQESVWTDPEMQAMAVAALEQETAEFHADADRTYLTGLSLGGYGAWNWRAAFPPMGGCGDSCRRHLLELCAGALAQTAAHCPANMPARWAARRCGCFMAWTIRWSPRGRAS